MLKVTEIFVLHSSYLFAQTHTVVIFLHQSCLEEHTVLTNKCFHDSLEKD